MTFFLARYYNIMHDPFFSQGERGKTEDFQLRIRRIIRIDKGNNEQFFILTRKREDAKGRQEIFTTKITKGTKKIGRGDFRDDGYLML